MACRAEESPDDVTQSKPSAGSGHCQAVCMAERVRVREIGDDEGRRLLRIVRRGTGSVVMWRRAQMVLLSAQGIPVARIAEVSGLDPGC